MSWTTAILYLFSQETDLLMKVIMKCANIKLCDILGYFHYILNAPRTHKIRLIMMIDNTELDVMLSSVNWCQILDFGLAHGGST